MFSHSTKVTSAVKREENGFNNFSSADRLDSIHLDISSSKDKEDRIDEVEDHRSNEDAQKQLVVYDPAANDAAEVQAFPQPIRCQPPPLPRKSFPNQSSRVLPSVGAFTVQCANCFKWRLIPTKEKYEEIREHIMEQPFFCETAREWRPEISCEDPPDISQDGSRLWAIDKPSIAQPPPGWQRLLRIRGEGSSKFADVYYVAPSGKRFRSMVEIQRYLLEHPEYVEAGVKTSQFSFQIPRPLQENYVRKRPARLTALCDDVNKGMPGLLEPSNVASQTLMGPDEDTDLRLAGPGLPSTFSDQRISEPVSKPAKKKARTLSRQKNSNAVCDRQVVKMEEPFRWRNGTL